MMGPEKLSGRTSVHDREVFPSAGARFVANLVVYFVVLSVRQGQVSQRIEGQGLKIDVHQRRRASLAEKGLFRQLPGCV